MVPGKVLNELKNMDWDKDTVPLVNFLNLTQEDLEKGYKTSELAEELSLNELQSLHGEISFVLESLLMEKNTRQVQELLTEKWANTPHIVEVVGKRIFTSAPYPGRFLEDLWLDFVTGFLYREWWKRATKCPVCRKWFYRPKSDRVYCNKACKNKADYYKHQEQRIKARRERYWRERDADGCACCAG